MREDRACECSLPRQIFVDLEADHHCRAHLDSRYTDLTIALVQNAHRPSRTVPPRQTQEAEASRPWSAASRRNFRRSRAAAMCAIPRGRIARLVPRQPHSGGTTKPPASRARCSRSVHSLSFWPRWRHPGDAHERSAREFAPLEFLRCRPTITNFPIHNKRCRHDVAQKSQSRDDRAERRRLRYNIDKLDFDHVAGAWRP